MEIYLYPCTSFFAFSYCSWGSECKNARVVCHPLLQWTTFCQNSPPRPIHLEWPYTACLQGMAVPWTSRTSNQSILKKIKPEYSLGGLMLMLQYFGHLMQRADSLEKTPFWERLKAGGKGDDRGQYDLMASLTQQTWDWASSNSRWWRQGNLACCSPWGRKPSQTQLSNWTTTNPPVSTRSWTE